MQVVNKSFSLMNYDEKQLRDWIRFGYWSTSPFLGGLILETSFQEYSSVSSNGTKFEVS